MLGTINLTKQENIHTDYKSSQCMHYAITFLGSNELKRNEIMYFKQIEYHWHVNMNSYWGESISMYPMWLSFFAIFNLYSILEHILGGKEYQFR